VDGILRNKNRFSAIGRSTSGEKELRKAMCRDLTSYFSLPRLRRDFQHKMERRDKGRGRRIRPEAEKSYLLRRAYNCLHPTFRKREEEGGFET
jgi:hypothetical protein